MRQKKNTVNVEKIRTEAANLGLNTEMTRKDGKKMKVRYNVLQRRINAVKREPKRLGVSQNEFVRMIKNDPNRYVLNSSEHLRPWGYSMNKSNNNRRAALKRAMNSGVWTKNRVHTHLKNIINGIEPEARRRAQYARNKSLAMQQAKAAAIAAYWKTLALYKAKKRNQKNKHSKNKNWLQ